MHHPASQPRDTTDSLFSPLHADDVDILIIEEKASDAELTMLAFRHHAPLPRMLWLDDCERALSYLLCSGQYEGRPPTPPLLVMISIDMPRTTGLELLARIRGEATLEALPIIVLTARASPTEVQACCRLGATGHVAKFVVYEAFTEQVTQAARHWLSAPRPVPDRAGRRSIEVCHGGDANNA
jgi:CheY-like chemotaxis protein